MVIKDLTIRDLAVGILVIIQLIIIIGMGNIQEAGVFIITMLFVAWLTMKKDI